MELNDELAANIENLLETIQQDMFDRAKERQDAKTRTATTKEEFYELIEEGGFVLAPWSEILKLKRRLKKTLVLRQDVGV